MLAALSALGLAAPVSGGGGGELRVTRDGDLQIVTIGEARFEVVDALLLGG